MANYAQGIGPWIPQLIARDENGSWRSTGLAARARSRGLLLHPYTIRADDLLPGLSLEELHRALFDREGVDGAFTDFPDLTRAFLDSRDTGE